MRIAIVVQARDARHLSEVGGRSTQVVALQRRGDDTSSNVWRKKRVRRFTKTKKPIINIPHPPSVQGGLDPSKKSGVGVDFELLVRSLHVRNKVEARKPSMIFR